MNKIQKKMIAITLSVGMIAASLLSGCATTREKEEAGLSMRVISKILQIWMVR